MRVKTNQSDEPLYEDQRIAKMDTEDAKSALDWSAIDTAYIEEAIGKTHSGGTWVEEAISQLQANFAELQFVFNRSASTRTGSLVQKTGLDRPSPS